MLSSVQEEISKWETYSQQLEDKRDKAVKAKTELKLQMKDLEDKVAKLTRDLKDKDEII